MKFPHFQASDRYEAIVKKEKALTGKCRPKFWLGLKAWPVD